jgi:hypothetical protein
MSGDGKAHWVLAQGKEDFGPILKNLNESFKHTGNTIYKGRNVLKELSWLGDAIIVKSFAEPNLLNRYIYKWVRKSKSRRAFEYAIKLAERKINTPSPIGYIEYYRRNCLAQSFYAYDKWPADFTAREVITNPLHPDRDTILSAIGEFAWQLHRSEVDFKDFSPGNILIRWGLSKELCLVDINRMSFQALSLKKRMRTFARLWAEDHDLSTIIAGYVRASGDDRALAVRLAVRYSQSHKYRSLRKEAIKSLLRLH